MGRNLSPVVRRELENLDKDAESRRSAMKALKSYVKDLDSKAIPLFLAQVSETKDPSSPSVEHTISLYEVLARVHGPNIVPQINNIMSTIINTLKSSAGSFPLQQACSKVVPAIARYGIDPMAQEDKKREVIHSLCKPLSDSLLGFQESLASGAALCLKALVDSDNWRYASDEMVNEVCLKVSGALEEKTTQTNSHMGLAMALAKHNNLIVEAYARSLIRSGLRILNAGVVDGNSQKRLSAIQMVNFLMKSLDIRSVVSELDIVIEQLERCNSDQMAFVRGAAFEALQTARMLASEKRSRLLEKDPGSVTGSNFIRRRNHNRGKGSLNSRDRSPVSASPESQTVNSFMDYDSLAESPTSTGMSSCNFECSSRSVNRKLWRNDNGGVDVSLKDGLHTGVDPCANGSKSHCEHFEDNQITDNEGDDEQSEIFSGFVHLVPRNGLDRSATPSPQKTCSQLSIDDIKIFTTPRKLIHSLQDANDLDNDFFNKQDKRGRTTTSSKLDVSLTRKMDRDGLSQNLIDKANHNKTSSEFGVGEQASNSSMSVSSNGDVAGDANLEVSHEIGSKDNDNKKSLSSSKREFRKTFHSLVLGFLFSLLAIIFSLILIDDREEAFYLVPT